MMKNLKILEEEEKSSFNLPNLQTIDSRKVEMELNNFSS